jgi:hypothetical protein
VHLPHDLLARGAVLDFEMGPTPSRWGAAVADRPASLSEPGAKPRPLVDVTAHATVRCSAGAACAPLVDDSSATSLATSFVRARLDEGPAEVAFYTITSEAPGSIGWTLKGSVDGASWSVIDTREGERFEAPRQTRPFKVARPGAFRAYWLELSGGAAELAEVELLTRPETN